MKIFPSLISSPLLNLEYTIQQLESHVDGYHLDVMDNHFVPNLTWGSSFINAIATVTNKTIWVHLMVTDPLSILQKLIIPSHSWVSFHIECHQNIPSIINYIKENNWKVSVAINPKTAISEIIAFLPVIDQVLVMSVEPGFSGQQFLPSALDTIDALVTHRSQHNLSFSIAGDGGINKNNIELINQKKVDVVAVASAIFSHRDPVKAIADLRHIIKQV